MADSVKVNDQVIARRKIRSGNLVRMGSVLRVDGDKALVQFPIDHCSAVLPISQLEKTSDRFSGYSSVQISAMRRGVFKRRGLV